MADHDTSVVAQGVTYKPSSTIRLFGGRKQEILDGLPSLS